MIKHSHVLYAAMLLSAAGATAQEVAYWNTYPLPGPLLAPAVVQGAHATLQTANAVHLYSAITRRWTVVPVSAGYVVHDGNNDHVIIQDGPRVHGWSNRAQAVASIVVNPTATVIPGIPGRSWVCAVVDGSTVHGFASFTGTWSRVVTQSATPTVQLNKVTMLVEDTATTYALSAYFGGFVTAPAGAFHTIGENLAVTIDGNDTVRGYSAYSNRWTATTFAGASGVGTPRSFNSYALIPVGSNVLAYSASTSGFATWTGGAAGSFTLAPEAAVFTVSGGVVGFCPAKATFASLPVAATAQILPGENRFGIYALVQDGNRLWGYSGVTGEFTPPLSGSFQTLLSDACAIVTGATTTYAYSALLNRFVAAPPAQYTGSFPLYNGAVLAHAGGLEGFSARHGVWTASAGAPGTIAFQGSILADTNRATCRLFDSRLDRWVGVTGQAPLTVGLWRLTAIMHDGVTAYGFSLYENQVDTVQIQGAIQQVIAQSEIGGVVTSTHLHVFTSFGSFAPLNRFPEFSRGQPRGTPMQLTQLGQPGDAAVLLVGDRAAFTPVPGLGTLFMDPARILLTQVFGVVLASGFLQVSLPVPADPALAGVELQLQNLVVPSSGSPWLTSSYAPLLL